MVKKRRTNSKTKNGVKEKYVRICPKCGSLDINFGMGVNTATPIFSAGAIINEYCRDCGYGENGGMIKFPQILESKAEKFRKDIKKNPEKYVVEDDEYRSSNINDVPWFVLILALCFVLVIVYFIFFKI